MLTRTSSGPLAFLFTLPLALAAIATTGCGSDVVDGPTAPSQDIATVDAPASAEPAAAGVNKVICKGNADDIKKLGSFCSGELSADMKFAQAGSRLATVGATTGPRLLVYAFPPAGVTDKLASWKPADVHYAAFLVLTESTDPASEWSGADPLTGTLGARILDNVACSETWGGAGELKWRGVTITVQWSIAIPR
jgi:hypothetical protein